MEQFPLFDENELDDLADKLGSYDLAYRRLGITPPRDEVDISISPATEPAESPVRGVMNFVEAPQGPSVSLEARAEAIAKVFDFYNKSNRARGAVESRYTGFGRYGSEADEVANRMHGKVETAKTMANTALRTLAATDEMIRSGVPQYEAHSIATSISEDMNRQYGPGNALAPDRAKKLRKVNAAVRHLKEQS